MEIEQILLQRALDSILHGSTQVVSFTDGNGNLSSRQEKVNDLRIPLVSEIARLLVNSPAFSKALENVFTSEVIKKIQETVLANIKYSDLPYDTRQRIDREMQNTKLEIRRFKVVADTMEEERQ